MSIFRNANFVCVVQKAPPVGPGRVRLPSMPTLVVLMKPNFFINGAIKSAIF